LHITAFITLLRPSQWLKNMMLYFPCFLGGALFQPGVLSKGIIPLVAFCAASSSTYIFNDIADKLEDREHPEKKLRPIASGILSVQAAAVLACLLLLAAMLSAVSISGQFTLILVAYVLTSSAYTLWLKVFPVIDLFCISSGFLLRLVAGGAVMGIAISEWLFLSVFLLAIFLSTGKRLGEKYLLGDRAGEHRKALLAYPAGFLDGIMYMTGGAVLVTYTMYVISRHSALLVYTVPLCCFGLLRYIFRLNTGKGGDPTESLTRDLPLFIVGLLWTVMVGWGIYGQ
jgi:decaprenyl-phosphate phosphoribosyltransferase